MYFCIGPIIFRGQACVDFYSGHIPRGADERFLQRVFEATVVQDYEWLASVSTETGLEDLKSLQSEITTDFEIVPVDDLAGLYEYQVRFSNGINAYVTLWGMWPCPDYIVTEEEIFERIEFGHIEIMD
jgi:hypothetical protein